MELFIMHASRPTGGTLRIPSFCAANSVANSIIRYRTSKQNSLRAVRTPPLPLTLVQRPVRGVARLCLQSDVTRCQDKRQGRQDDGVQATYDGQQVCPPQTALSQLVASRRRTTRAPDVTGVPASRIGHYTNHKTHGCNRQEWA